MLGVLRLKLEELKAFISSVPAKGFEILEKEDLAPKIKRIVVKAPLVARKAKTGQFVILRVDEKGERIPLTLVEWDKEKGTITLVFQEVGASTVKLGKLSVGDKILDLVGPLGNPSELEKFGRCCVVGGGLGIALAYPIARDLKALGNYVVSVIGARSKNLLFFEEKMKSVSDELHICTDDGSYGFKGFTSQMLEKLLAEGAKFDYCFCVGPVPMMKAVAEVTRRYGIKTVCSLNPIMVDGTGMCGACRVTVGGEMKFACVDGPDFDAHQVDFDELMARLRTFSEEEKLALERAGWNRG